jgi:hypothetical protein
VVEVTGDVVLITFSTFGPDEQMTVKFQGQNEIVLSSEDLQKLFADDALKLGSVVLSRCDVAP